MAKEYGIQWSEFGRDDRLVAKEKFFATEDQREKFATKLEDKASFNEILAWHDPRQDD